MTKRVSAYTVKNIRGKTLLETDNLRQARIATWRRSYEERARIVYSLSVARRLSCMQLKTRARCVQEDAFRASNFSGLIVCATILPRQDAGMPYEYITFVPALCYKNVPPSDRSMLNAINRTFL